MVRVATPTKGTGNSTAKGTPNKLRRKIPEATAAEAPAARLVEYFVVVSSQPRWNTSGGASPTKKGGKGSSQTNIDPTANGNIHLPASAQQHDYTFSPKITARYPLVDNPDNPLNPMITQFCYPHSDSIVPSNTYVMPRIHHFVLTNDKGCKVYGTCLTLYEEYVPKEGTKDPYDRRNSVQATWKNEDIEVTVMNEEELMKDTTSLYIPRVLCILSTWPYLLAFREYLTQLYRLTLSTTMEAPLERYIQNLCREIPAPPPGAFEIELTILDSSIRFWAPPAKLPVSYVALPYQTLFECLDLDNILKVWYALLMEQKVLLISSQYSILTVCAEILQSLLFPLKWSHLYVPLLPRFLSPMLDAPIPYLVGVIRENWVYAESSVSDETMVVDLDSNEIIPARCAPALSSPPLKKWTKLKTALEETVGDLFWKTRGLEAPYHLMMRGKLSPQQFEQLRQDRGTAGWKEKLRGFDDAFNMAYMPDSPNLTQDGGALDETEQSQWERVQEAFLRFFVTALKSYQKFLHVPDENNASDPQVADADAGNKRWNHARRSFDRDGFITWQKQDSQTFYRELSMTQQFDDFITKRLYSPGEPDVIFFDQSIDSKKNRSKLRMKKVETPFLLNAKAHKVLQKVRAVEPSNEGLPEGRVYRYKTWPDKFDTSLFGAPRPIPNIITAEFDRQAALVARLRATHHEDEKDDFLLGGDFDASPEVAAFTVFFFTYGAIVGRDWKMYQDKMQEESAMNIVEEELQVGEETEPIPLEIKNSEEGDNSDPVTVATVGETVTSTNKDATAAKEEEKIGDDCGLCDDLLPSGMILSVPDCKLPQCNPRLGDNQFVAMWSQGDPRNSGVGPSLLDMDDDDLAEYEEAKEIAAAQLELAFEALSSMPARGLPTDPDAFKSLMEACGRCGNTDKAMQLIQIMKRDGFVADSEIYSCFLYAFAAQEEAAEAHHVEEAAPSDLSPSRSSDAYSAFLKKRMQQSKAADAAMSPYDIARHHNSSGTDEDGFDLKSESTVSESSVKLDSSLMTDIYNAVFTPQKKPQRKRKKSKKKSLLNKRAPLPGDERMQLQIALGDSLLSYVYPKYSIDTDSNSCPQCSTVLNEDHIVSGWTPCEFEDFNTECPQCEHRFVPHFTVRCASPDFVGTQGKGTPLYCEFLSPWVLRKELEFIIHGMDGVEGMVDPEWRNGTDIRATLWWNLIVAFNRYRLPFSFLFQGSFQNRLINPTPGDR